MSICVLTFIIIFVIYLITYSGSVNLANRLRSRCLWYRWYAHIIACTHNWLRSCFSWHWRYAFLHIVICAHNRLRNRCIWNTRYIMLYRWWYRDVAIGRFSHTVSAGHINTSRCRLLRLWLRILYPWLCRIYIIITADIRFAFSFLISSLRDLCRRLLVLRCIAGIVLVLLS